MAFETIRLEREGPFARLTVNRPDKLNAVSPKVMEEMGRAVGELLAAGDCRGLILTGEGRAFIAGADIGWLADLSPPDAEGFSRFGQEVLFRMENAPFPVIAAVNGYALGGGLEVAMACDVILASEKAKFGQPEVTLGVVPGLMGSQRLHRLVGAYKAKELLMTGEIIDAAEAYRIGLANKVVAPEKLLDEAKALLTRIAANGPIAVAQAKRLVNVGIGTDPRTAGALEAEVFGVLFSTKDQKEGMRAFVEKRKPTFRGE